MTFALVVVGSAGSGKSTVAREIARRCTAVYLDKDRLAGPLVEVALSAGGHAPQEREDSTFYRDEVMPAEYASLLSVAADNLRLGLPVVIDAPFAGYLQDPHFLESATAAALWPPGVHTVVLRVVTSESQTRRRLEARGLGRDHAKLAMWDTYWSTWGRSTIEWVGVSVMELDNSDAPDLHEVLSRLVT